MRASFTIGLLALVGAGCSASGPIDVGIDDDLGGGRLAIVRNDGSLVVVAPVGGEPVVVAEPVGSQAPLAVTWSPDGSRLAWSHLDADGPHVAVASLDGDPPAVTPTSFHSFFLSWDHAGEQLGSLGSANGGVSLVTIADGAESDIAATGQPMYFSWAADGERVAAHRSDELDIITFGQDPSARPEPAAPLGAPVWLPDDRVVFSTLDGDETVITVGELEGIADELIRGPGVAQVVADGDGRRLAVTFFGGTEGFEDSTDGLLPASFGAGSDGLASTGVYVVDLVTGETERILDDQGLWMTWSPNGERLLVMTPAQTIGRTSWVVWDEAGARVVTETFVPSADFVTDYLPFADQWDQAIDLWAPDSEAFVYPSVVPGGESSILLQELDGGLPESLGPGYFVTWSAG